MYTYFNYTTVCSKNVFNNLLNCVINNVKLYILFVKF